MKHDKKTRFDFLISKRGSNAAVGGAGVCECGWLQFQVLRVLYDWHDV